MFLAYRGAGSGPLCCGCQGSMEEGGGGEDIQGVGPQLAPSARCTASGNNSSMDISWYQEKSLPSPKERKVLV